MADTTGTDDIDGLFATVLDWAENDLDSRTRAEAKRLLARAQEPGDGADAALAELRDAFGGRLAFGTAGLRGRLGAGPRRMNRVVVSQTSAGFAAFLHDRAAAGGADNPPSVVIGYDGRTNSRTFAVDTAEIMAGAGCDVFLLPEAGPTPLTAFAVRHLGASAGVMITASHNPPKDNGYKVYLGDVDAGSQIVPPADGEIAAHIDRAARGPAGLLPRSRDYSVLGDGVADDYVSRTASTVLAGLPLGNDGLPLGHDVDLTVVYTAMHGVGARIAARVYASCGLPSVVPVREQQEPDAVFPTVSFPNPEEPGALDLAFRTARNHDADLIIAHDPDADRLAIALPDPEAAAGYRRLTGNEVGLLLGWRAAARETARANLADEAPRGTLACTIVSSPVLGAVAREYGLDYAETLSGFKWVSRAEGLIFGFEEALGYLTSPGIVRDKDGISASADAIAMVRECRAAGRTVQDLLDQASLRFGHFASAQVTVRPGSMDRAAELAWRIRQSPPTEFGEVPVSDMQDLLEPGAAAVRADVLRFSLEDGSRVMIRPSGTEPKLKVYLDTFSAEGSAEDRRHEAETALGELESSVRAYLDAL